MEQTSKLSIVVDTSKAQSKLKLLSTDLKRMERDGLGIGKAFSKMSSANHFAGLNQSIDKTQQSINALTKTAENSTAAINSINTSAKSLRTTTAGIASSMNAAQVAMAKFTASSKAVRDNLTAVNSSMAQARSGMSGITGSMGSAAGATNNLSKVIKTLKADLSSLATALNTSTGAVNRFSQAAKASGTNLNTLNNTSARTQVRMGALSNSVVTTRNQMGSLSVTTNGLNNFLRNSQTTTAQLAGSTTALNTALTRANTATVVLGGGINRTNTQARGLMATLTSLQGLLLGSFVGVAGLSIIKTADAMQNLNSQVKLVTNSTEEYLGIRQKVRDLADKNYSDIGATVTIYQNAARALSNLGRSQADAIKLTDGLSLAMMTGGRSAQEQASALLQTSQALSSGTLAGDEFKALAENAPILLELVAKKMGVLPGALKKIAADGKIISEILSDAIIDNIGMLEEMAAQMPITMGQAFTVAKNQYKYALDDMMNATGGMSSVIASSISGIARNFTALGSIIIAGALAALVRYTAAAAAAAIAGSGLSVSALSMAGSLGIYTASVGALNATLGAYVKIGAVVSSVTNRALAVQTMGVSGAFAAAAASIKAGVVSLGQWSTYSRAASLAGVGLATATTAATGAFMRFATVLNAHPLMFLATVLLGVVASTKDAEGQMLGLEGAISSLGDAIGVVGIILGNFINMGVDGFSTLLNSAGGFISGFVNGTKDGANQGSANLSVFFEGTQKGFVGIIQGAATMFDAASLTILSFVQKGINHFKNLVVAAQNAVSGFKSWLGFGDDGQQAYFETNFSAIMDGKSDSIFGNGLRSMVDNAITEQGARKASQTAPYSPSTSPMDMTKKHQYEQQKAADALIEAKKAETKASRKNAQSQAKEELVRKAVLGGKDWGVSSGYGGARGHNGIDIPTPRGTQVYAPESGTIKAYGDNSARGGKQMILIADSGKQYGFAHLDSFDVASGTRVPAGMGIAKSGATGTRPNGKGYNAHLHLTVTDVNGKKVDPTKVSVGKSKYDNTIGSANAKAAAAAQREADKAQRERERAMAAAARHQAEVDAARIAATKEYGTQDEKLKTEHAERVMQIRRAEYSDAETARLITLSDERRKRELAVYAKGLNDRIAAATAFKKTEREILLQEYDDAVFAAKNDPELSRADNKSVLEAVLKGIDAEYEYRLDKYTEALEQQRSALYDYQKTERQILADGWFGKIEDAKLATDELAAERVTALEAQRDQELKVFDLTQQDKLLELRKAQVSETDYIKEKYRLEGELLNQLVASDEFKAAQRAANAENYKNSLSDLKKRVGGDYDAQTRGLFGLSSAGVELDASNQSQRDIAKKAFDEQYIQEEEYKQRLLDLETDYINKKQAIVVGGYESAFAMAGGLMKAFGGENSRFYKTMFLTERAYALQKAWLNSKTAVMDMWAKTPGGYFAKAMAAGKVAMETGVITAAIAAIEPMGFKKGGYTGGMGVNDIAGVVHGQEYVFDAQATKRIGVDNLNAMRSGKAPQGGDNINVNVTVNSDGSSNVESNKQMGRSMGNALVATIQQQIIKEKRQGGLLYG